MNVYISWILRSHCTDHCIWWFLVIIEGHLYVVVGLLFFTNPNLNMWKKDLFILKLEFCINQLISGKGKRISGNVLDAYL